MKKAFIAFALLISLSNQAFAVNSVKFSASYSINSLSTKRDTVDDSNTSASSIFHGPKVSVHIDKFFLAYQIIKGETAYTDTPLGFDPNGHTITKGDLTNSNTNTTIYAGISVDRRVNLYLLSSTRDSDRTRSNAYNVSTGTPVPLSNPNTSSTYKGTGLGFLGNFNIAPAWKLLIDISSSNLDNSSTDQAYKETFLRGGANFAQPGSPFVLSLYAVSKKRSYDLLGISTSTTGLGAEAIYHF